VTDEGPRLTYLGTYESGVHHLTSPRAVLAPVEQKIDAERARREAEAVKAKLQIL
jgi:hypothetical protein